MNHIASGEQEPVQLLPTGTVLHRRYRVDGVLGCGTYGVTYFGLDEKTGTPIALKEYFPCALAGRAEGGTALSPKNKACGTLFFLGSEMFYKQHQALTEARGSDNLVTVYAAFFENGTSYAVMERLEGVTLARYLQLKRRGLFADEAMFIAASLADALLVLHSLNTLHFDINARSIFLCTDGSVKLTDFSAAKAGLRARREVDDAESWIDLAAVAKTLYEAMTGQAAFDERIQPHASVPPQMFDLFRQMLDEDSRNRGVSVFDYRHALACVEVGAVCPDVTQEDAHSDLPEIRKPDVRNRQQNPPPVQEPEEPQHKRSILDRALDAMESAVVAEKQVDERKALNEMRIKKRVGIIYAGIIAGVLVLALILRGLIH